ncbi:MAG: ABC transporter ATP-binding protein [bacterium]
MSFLQLLSLNHEYIDGENMVRVLDNISCEFEKGSIHVVLGPSGCGKTTLLNIIAGLIKPVSGEVILNNNPIVKPIPEIGVVFQDLRLFPWLKVKDNVAFGLRMKNDNNIESIVDKYLELVGLTEYKDFYPADLSGGMKQRLAIIRSLVLEPHLLLLDEPFGSLDLKTRKSMQELITKLHRELKTTIIFVTHDIDEAVVLGDFIYIFSGYKGKIDKILRTSNNKIALKNEIINSLD